MAGTSVLTCTSSPEEPLGRIVVFRARTPREDRALAWDEARRSVVAWDCAKAPRGRLAPDAEDRAP